MIACQACQTVNEAGNSFCSKCGKPLKSAQTDSTSAQISGLMTIDPDSLETDIGRISGQNGPELAPGSIFAGRYTVVEKIGQGGMGVVYRAKETLAGRDREIALKLIRSDRLTDQKSIDKLLSEGALTQDIRHPNVVGVYNVGDAGGQPFVAMEFVEGVSLREWLRRQVTNRLDVPLLTAGSIIRSLLDGLDAAHKMGIVHRDLKPENVMLTGDPGSEGAPLKILDFGIARTPGGQESGTGTGLGTPRYMAPEQITNPDSVTPPADLYSLSVIFYELLMEVLPQGHWQPPSGGRPDVGPAVDKLIEQGLSNRPGSRPQDVADYRAKLDAALKAVRVEPIGGGSGIDRVKEEHRFDPKTLKIIGFSSAGVLALLVLVGVIGNIPAPDPDFSRDELLSGQWVLTSPVQNQILGSFNMTVLDDGSFSGMGIYDNDPAASVTGNVRNGSYQASANGGSAQGTITQDQNSPCHFTLQSGGFSALFHVYHPPGAPCPPKFNQ